MLSKRNRLISFRLSEQEYRDFETDCFLQGSRSLSDHARVLVSGMLRRNHSERSGRAGGGLHQELRHVVDEVSRLVGVAESLETRALIESRDRVTAGGQLSLDENECDSQ